MVKPAKTHTIKRIQYLFIAQIILASTGPMASFANGSDGGERKFDKAAAVAALSAAARSAEACGQPGGLTGIAKVAVVFAPNGSVTSSNVDNPPFAGTPVGGCIASAFRSAKVPLFAGKPVSMTKKISIK